MNLKLRTITTRNNLTIVMLRQSNVVQLASNWLWWRMRLKPEPLASLLVCLGLEIKTKASGILGGPPPTKLHHNHQREP